MRKWTCVVFSAWRLSPNLRWFVGYWTRRQTTTFPNKNNLFQVKTQCKYDFLAKHDGRLCCSLFPILRGQLSASMNATQHARGRRPSTPPSSFFSIKKFSESWWNSVSFDDFPDACFMDEFGVQWLASWSEKILFYIAEQVSFPIFFHPTRLSPTGNFFLADEGPFNSCRRSHFKGLDKRSNSG